MNYLFRQNSICVDELGFVQANKLFSEKKGKTFSDELVICSNEVVIFGEEIVFVWTIKDLFGRILSILI